MTEQDKRQMKKSIKSSHKGYEALSSLVYLSWKLSKDMLVSTCFSLAASVSTTLDDVVLGVGTGESHSP